MRKSRNCWRRNRSRNGRTNPSLKRSILLRGKSLNRELGFSRRVAHPKWASKSGVAVGVYSDHPALLTTGAMNEIKGESTNGNTRNLTYRNRFARPVAHRAKETSGAGKGAHQALRPRQCRATPPPHGEARKGLRLRRPQRQTESQGPFRRPPPAHRLSLHVRPVVG